MTLFEFFSGAVQLIVLVAVLLLCDRVAEIEARIRERNEALNRALSAATPRHLRAIDSHTRRPT